MAKWSVYNLTYPGDATQGSRAAGYVGRYQQQRWENWALALKDAERRLDIRADDYELRQELYQDQREMLLDEIGRIADARQDYIDGVSTAQQAVDRRNVAARNSNTRFNTGVENRQRAADASAAASGTGGGGGASGPELVSAGTDIDAIAARAALRARQDLSDAGDIGANDIVDAMAQGYQSINDTSLTSVEMPNASQMASARLGLVDNLIGVYAQSSGQSLEDASFAVKNNLLQRAMNPDDNPEIAAFQARFENDRALLTPQEDSGSATPEEAPQFQRAGVLLEQRPTVDDERVAAYDARKAELQAALDLLEVPTTPELEAGSLIEEARAAYRGAFPVPSRRRPASGLERMAAAARARGVPVDQARADALAAVRARMAAPAQPEKQQPTPVGAGAAPAQPEKQQRPRTPKEEDQYQRLRLGMRGVELARDQQAMQSLDENEDLAIVRQLYDAADNKKVSIIQMQNELKDAVDSGAQDMALQCLSALHAKDKQDTLLSAPD